MDANKILEVLDKYEAYFATNGIHKKKHPPESHPKLAKDVLCHLHAMIDEMRGFVRNEQTDKAFRWLGFMQGTLWCQGIYTLEKLKKENRPR